MKKRSDTGRNQRIEVRATVSLAVVACRGSLAHLQASCFSTVSSELLRHADDDESAALVFRVSERRVYAATFRDANRHHGKQTTNATRLLGTGTLAVQRVRRCRA